MGRRNPPCSSGLLTANCLTCISALPYGVEERWFVVGAHMRLAIQQCGPPLRNHHWRGGLHRVRVQQQALLSVPPRPFCSLRSRRRKTSAGESGHSPRGPEGCRGRAGGRRRGQCLGGDAWVGSAVAPACHAVPAPPRNLAQFLSITSFTPSIPPSVAPAAVQGGCLGGGRLPAAQRRPRVRSLRRRRLVLPGAEQGA